ncbi:MAG: hypothetical protein J3Q66DRAFT_384383 [Benniella sp.]|nr:MAG: hypothetical protein J3Q66DRAFT_384383 [Benniella sp.]
MKSFAVSALIVAAVAAVANAQAPTFTDCGSGDAGMNVSSFSISDVCIGETYCVTATGQLNGPVVAGSTFAVQARVQQSNTHVFTESHDNLCGLLDQPCPVSADSNSIKICLPFKKEYQVMNGIPFNFRFVATNPSGLLFCQSGLVTPKLC